MRSTEQVVFPVTRDVTGSLTQHDPELGAFYDFTGASSLASVDGLGPTLSCTRALDTATVYNSAGKLQTVLANTARFDHDPATLEPKGLLIEGGATNLCLQSNDLSTTWANTRSTDTQSAGISPDGTNNANSIDEDGTAANTHYVDQAIAMSNSTNYALSAYLKASNRTWGFLQAYGLSGTAECYYDLTNGVIASPSGHTSAGIINCGNGWYRCWLVFPTTTVTTSNVLIAPASGDGGVSFDGLSQESILMYGAQLEQSAYYTSYIPTTTLAVARNTDVISTTDLSFLDATATAEGTIYCEGSFWSAFNLSSSIAIQLDDGTSSDRILLYRATSEVITAFTVSSTGDSGSFTDAGGARSIDTPVRMALRYALNDVNGAVDGVLGTPDTTATLPLTDNPTTFRIGTDQADALPWDGWLKIVKWYKTDKGDAFIENLSNGN